MLSNRSTAIDCGKLSVHSPEIVGKVLEALWSAVAITLIMSVITACNCTML